MLSSDTKYAQQVGGWYAVAATASGIIAFLLIVTVAGILLMGYHPLYLIKDLVYIYNYGFFVGIIFALVISFIIGRSAGKAIANNPAHWAKAGLKASLTILALSVSIGVLVLYVRTHDPTTSRSLSFELSSWGTTYIFIFSMGLFPAVLMGYLYGKIVKWKITESSR